MPSPSSPWPLVPNTDMLCTIILKLVGYSQGRKATHGLPLPSAGWESHCRCKVILGWTVPNACHFIHAMLLRNQEANHNDACTGWGIELLVRIWASPGNEISGRVTLLLGPFGLVLNESRTENENSSCVLEMGSGFTASWGNLLGWWWHFISWLQLGPRSEHLLEATERHT